ncbi:hypothetical protein RB195_009889 [Necator americanus]|uniref:Uncharacterized protein n=1 Tax=Necator americanus TaxID=51031 RepID=A0ABR1CVD8_NECAM
MHSGGWKESAPGLAPRKMFVFASVKTVYPRAILYVLPALHTGDSGQEKRLRRSRRQVKRDHENDRTPRAKEFEKEWDENMRKAHTLLRQHSVKMKFACSEHRQRSRCLTPRI